MPYPTKDVNKKTPLISQAEKQKR